MGEVVRVRQGTDDAELRDRVRVPLDHEALGFGTRLVAARLPVAEEELLFGSEAVDGLRGRSGERLAESKPRNRDSAEVAYRFAEHQLPLVVDARLDEIAVELIRDALAAFLELRAVRRCPPVHGSALLLVVPGLTWPSKSWLFFVNGNDDADHRRG